MNGPQTDYYYTQNEQDIGDFKCDICALTFRISSERNVHILSHFQKGNCSICSGTLIRLGNIWYIIREHPDHNVNRNDIGVECRLEAVFCDAFKSEPGPIHNESTETQIEDCFTAIEGGSPVKTENDNTNYQTEFVRVSEFIEQKPLNIIDEPYSPVKDTDIKETPGDGDMPMFDNYEPNDGENDALKIKTKGRCKICMKAISCPTTLKYHMNIHLGIKPHVCECCERAFTDKRNLTRHRKICKGKRKPKKIAKPPSSTMESKLDMNVAHKNMPKNNDSILKIPGVVEQKIPFDIADESMPTEHDNFQRTKDNGVMPEIKTKHSQPNTNTQMEDTNLVVLEIIEPKNFKLTAGQMKSMTCPICSKKLTRVVGLKAHMAVHRKPTYQCKLCTFYTFDTIDKYRAHNLAQHAIPEYSIKELDEDDDKMAERESENTDWVCEYCNTDFKLEINLAKHIHKDHNDQKSEHSCNICIEKFSDLSDLLAHMRAHPESTRNKCTFDGCKHGFAYRARLTAHLAKHSLIDGQIIRKTQDDVRAVMMKHAAIRLSGSSEVKGGAPDEDITCNICSKKLATRTMLMHHIQIAHKNERIKCLSDGCDSIFKGKLGLFSHVKVFHPELVRECDTCKKGFYSDAKLAEHQKQHNSMEFSCTICSEKFALKHRFISHMSSHEKEAKCDICNEMFRSVKGMMMHRERHGKQQTISCRFPGCNKIFETRREFVLHARQHPEDEKSKFICPHCGKAISKAHLNDHINTHTGATPYECSVCKKKFSKSGSLRRHNMIHTGVKPYVCGVDGCKQAYRDSIDLKRHKFSVHKIYTKKHICSICSKVFSERKLLRNHIVKVHDKIEHESALQMDQNS